MPQYRTGSVAASAFERPLSQKSKIFDSSPYAGELLRSWRIVLRVYVLREEQRAMPAYEEPPVLPGGSFFFLGIS